MKHNHPPILRLVIAVLLLGLAIGGGPVMFVLLVMASPSILAAKPRRSADICALPLGHRSH
jgi:hypothetical protein